MPPRSARGRAASGFAKLRLASGETRPSGGPPHPSRRLKRKVLYESWCKVIGLAFTIGRRCLWRWRLLLCIASAWTQEDTSRAIAPVVIIGERPLRVYEWRADSLGGWQVTGTHLSQLLSQVEGLYIRDYGGEGALKTVSLRGLSPTFTAITFQGFPIRQPQLGIVNIAPYFLGGFSEITFSGGGELGYHPGGAGRIDLAIRPGPSLRWGEGRLGRYGEAAMETAAGNNHYIWYGGALSTLNRYPYDDPIRGRMESAAYRLLRAGLALHRGRWETTLWGFGSEQEVPGPVGLTGPRLPPEYLREWQIMPTFWYQGKWSIGLQSHISRLLYRDYLGLLVPTYQYSMQGMLRREWSRGGHTITTLLYGAGDHLQSPRIGRGFIPLHRIRQGELGVWLQGKGTLRGWNYRWEGRLSWLERFRPEVGALVQVERRYGGIEGMRGLRWPSLYERYWIGYGRWDLRPERFYQVQGYGRYQWGAWSFRSTLTAAWVKDRILTVPLSPVRWQAYNLGYVRSLAAEIRLNYTSFRTQAHLSVTYTRAQDFSVTAGRPLPYVPPWVGALWINRHLGRMALIYQGEFVSERPISLASGALNILPPYLLHSLSLKWRLSHSLLTIHLSRWSRQTYAVISGYPMPVRQVLLEWRWMW